MDKQTSRPRDKAVRASISPQVSVSQPASILPNSVERSPFYYALSAPSAALEESTREHIRWITQREERSDHQRPYPSVGFGAPSPNRADRANPVPITPEGERQREIGREKKSEKKKYREGTKEERERGKKDRVSPLCRQTLSGHSRSARSQYRGCTAKLIPRLVHRGKERGRR